MFASPLGKTSGRSSSVGASKRSGSRAELLGQLVEPGQRAAAERRPAELGAGGDGVEPRRGVVVGLVGAVGEPLDGLVEVRGALGVGDEVGGLGLRHPDRRPQDDPGQADAADGRPEQLRLRALGLDPADLAGAGEQVHRDHVVAEAAGGVVVLAVDVVGDRAADGDLARAGQDRDPQPERQRDAHQPVEGHARVEVDQAASPASIAWMRSRAVMSTTRPPAFCAGSP